VLEPVSGARTCSRCGAAYKGQQYNVVTPAATPVLAAGASAGHTPGLIFDVSSIPGQIWQPRIHWVGAQSLAVTFIVKATESPEAPLYELTGVQLSVQLTAGVYTVVKGVGIQVVSQNPGCGPPAGGPMAAFIPAMLWTFVHGDVSIGTRGSIRCYR
jgi:hypothetical protein